MRTRPFEELSCRALNAICQRFGCTEDQINLDMLQWFSDNPDESLRPSNFGKKSLQEIREVIAHYSFGPHFPAAAEESPTRKAAKERGEMIAEIVRLSSRKHAAEFLGISISRVTQIIAGDTDRTFGAEEAQA